MKRLLLLVPAVFILTACKPAGEAVDLNQYQSGSTQTTQQTTKTGGTMDYRGDVQELKIEDIKVGTGATVEAGDTVLVHYTGQLIDGKVFDSSKNRGEPISFGIGVGQVIQGWDQGIVGMKEGGTRKLTIPPELGYGSRGAGAAIPPNATLIFEVELIEIQ